MNPYQQDLFELQPNEICVAPPDTLATIARIESAGVVVSVMERVPGRNADWRLRVIWPRLRGFNGSIDRTAKGSVPALMSKTTV
jgi:hypothetical protein